MNWTQRRIFIFGALGYFELGALLEGLRPLMSYKLAQQVFAIFTEHVVPIHNILDYFILNSVGVRNKNSHNETNEKRQRWSHLTTFPLHIYWVSCAITRFSRLKSWLWVKHPYPVFYQWKATREKPGLNESISLVSYNLINGFRRFVPRIIRNNNQTQRHKKRMLVVIHLNP